MIWKKIGSTRYVYDFSVDYNAIAVDDILDIQKYLMKKNEMNKIFGFIKKHFFIVFLDSTKLKLFG